MPFELRVALRYLTARRKQAFISAISLISALGVAVGVMALMIALGLMTGLQREIRSKILGTTAHLHVFRSRAVAFDDYAAVIRRLEGLPGVAGAAPALYGKALIGNGSATAFATVKGVRPGAEANVTDIAEQFAAGGLAELEPRGEGVLPGIALGRNMAISLGVGVGDVVSVTSPRGRLSPLGMLPRMVKFRVVGTVRSGLYEFDNAWAWVGLESAQRLADAGAGVSQVEIRVSDMWRVRETAGVVLEALGEGYTTTDWIEMNAPLFQALWLEKTAIALTIFLIVMVAALNIVATLILMVMEKHQDIAILVSMGASRAAIHRIFVLQGSLIGAVGTLVGGALGWLVCDVFDRYRLLEIPGDVYQITHVPFILQPRDAALVVVGAFAICFLSTLYPARGAMRLDPAEALRHE